ncbi:PH domain-containing protein [Nocardioides humilatus]|uniref:PH domain-containing protein n=1 Tax=Nocardioides humilatus TaxID=2607660 RepID=A0A5B1LKL7_9ACTN|nr:PH domain-containing protein [Nocardioides humilatus]KAA1421103.1 PH domain-containing protein [Nocardioides humilatus]
MAISSKLLNPGEKLVVSCRQHPKALFGPILALVFFLAVGVALQVVLGTDSDATLWTSRVVWIICAVGILWFTVRPFFDWLTTVYGVTDRRLITRRGILTRQGHDIPLSRISDLSIEINLIDRPFGCGSLVVTDASTFGVVRLNDIPQVEATQRQINELLHALDGRGHNPRTEGV